MFAELPPLASSVSQLEAAGGPGGVCDAAAILARPERSSDDAAGAAGWPFFGQLIAHDITADRSQVGPHADVAA
jgi:hypothetical protein